MEWLWLGNGLGIRVIVCAVVILTGVVMAIRPSAKSRQKVELRGQFRVGIIAAIIAGFGQGTGAVISRKAEAVALELGVHGSNHRRLSAGSCRSIIFRSLGAADPIR